MEKFVDEEMILLFDSLRGNIWEGKDSILYAFLSLVKNCKQEVVNPKNATLKRPTYKDLVKNNNFIFI